MEASTRKRLRPAQQLACGVLLPPLIGGPAVLCLLLALALSFNQRAKADNPLAQRAAPGQLAEQLTVHLEGTAVHYQDTGFGQARKSMAQTSWWKRHKEATESILRPDELPEPHGQAPQRQGRLRLRHVDRGRPESRRRAP